MTELFSSYIPPTMSSSSTIPSLMLGSRMVINRAEGPFISTTRPIKSQLLITRSKTAEPVLEAQSAGTTTSLTFKEINSSVIRLHSMGQIRPPTLSLSNSDI